MLNLKKIILEELQEVVRSTNSDEPSLDLNRVYQQEPDMKPKGLWYEIDDDWKKWCSYGMPEWLKKYDIRIELDMSNILILKSKLAAKLFVEKYGIDDGGYMYYINWPRVAEDYDGIELPDGRMFSYTPEFRSVAMFTSWDVDSGCVWNLKAIKNYEVHECDPEYQNKD
jgi:hypothetical protein